ncbi:MAG: hypothetical protein ACOY5B_10660 [Spirochaetota bacterium]
MAADNKVDYRHPSKGDQWRFFGGTGAIALLITGAYFAGAPSYWLGWAAFAVAAFSVAGNDAIQTVGTFIESKEELHWLPKALFLIATLVGVHIYAWFLHGQEIHFQRLDAFAETKNFNLVQLLAPIVLVVITRLKAPVSTTFLILGLFGTQNIEKMLVKSFLGYGIAFLCGIAVWGFLARIDRHEYSDDHVPDAKQERLWGALQWLSTLYLWVAWLLQDTANIAVFLPRKLDAVELMGALGLISLALVIIVRTNGGTIQEVVSEKSDIKWSKAATIVDLVYATVLLVFQQWSKMPMSTTWVFLGLLAGREIILHRVTQRQKPYLQTLRQVGKDVMLASLGIAVSIFIFVLAGQVYGK